VIAPEAEEPGTPQREIARMTSWYSVFEFVSTGLIHDSEWGKEQLEIALSLPIFAASLL
jgi:hypothetical protein